MSLASEPELRNSPDDLLNIVGQIKGQEDQQWVIQRVIFLFFLHERMGCLLSLIHALEGKASLKHFRDLAIRKAFEEGSRRGNMPIVERLYDHPAITPKDYAQGLINAGGKATYDLNFIFLLPEADRDDLIA